MNTDDLTTIGLHYSTDKAVDHKFTPFYHEKLQHLRDKNINLLEIGIFYAQSLKTWKDYFPFADIFGVDIVDCSRFAEDRIFIEQGDQTDNDKLQSMFSSKQFDIIIDDGGHTMYQQQYTFINIFNRLKSGGVFIIEDLHTSLVEPDYSTTTLKMVEDLVDGSCKFTTPHINHESLKLIADQLTSVEIFRTKNGHSVTSLMIKK